jgi:hypothetical protein
VLYVFVEKIPTAEAVIPFSNIDCSSMRQATVFKVRDRPFDLQFRWEFFNIVEFFRLQPWFNLPPEHDPLATPPPAATAPSVSAGRFRSTTEYHLCIPVPAAESGNSEDHDG